MIYVFANTGPEATRFVVDARLAGHRVRMYTTVESAAGLRFNEEDEVFVLTPMEPELRAQVRISHDKSYPKPHIFKEVSRERAQAR